MLAFQQVFSHDEFGPLRSALTAPRFIIDAGANVGYASACFLSWFPQAKVLAIEPDPGNYRVCKENLAPYGNRVQVVCGAVWSDCRRLSLSRGSFGDGGDWATQVRQEAGGGDVTAWDVPTLLKMAGEAQIDLLKMDIERSELEVFARGTDAWLRKTKNICIELHGPDCEEAFFQALKDFKFDKRIFGEHVLCLNLK